jgi:hypothetical protein
MLVYRCRKKVDNKVRTEYLFLIKSIFMFQILSDIGLYFVAVLPGTGTWYLYLVLNEENN